MKVFSFKKLRDRLYELRFDDQHEMCMTFLRYQEFYESPRYVGRKFTLAEFMSWYVKDQNKDGSFSYPRDWGGFNLPVDIIAQVRNLGIDDPNHYDSLMHFVWRAITAECDGAYLIGVTQGAQLDRHEATHAMFHIDDAYRSKVMGVLQSQRNADLVGKLQVILMKSGYAEVTSLDEVNAYVTTGDHNFFKDHKKTHGYRQLSQALKALHELHYPIFTKDIKAAAPVK